MRILLFGGTRFLGRAIAEVALARSHELTLFHRGVSNPSLWPAATHVRGDRTRDLALLEGAAFDAVIDTSGFEVSAVRAAARAVRAAPRYVFVSSISVYADPSRMDEEAPLHAVEDAETATLDAGNYGALKAACERALEEELPGRVLSVRAGKIDGPHDIDARFRYWVCRVAKGGEVLAPGDPEAIVQEVDVRDLAAWIVRAAETGVKGVVNATGEPATMRAFLETIREVLAAPARFTWVPDEILVQDGVRPYSEMPYWLPKSLGARAVPIERAVRAGLRFRPFAETVRDTWEWMERSWEEEAHVRAQRRLIIPAGISPERERKLLLRAAAPEETRT
jgi:2'-hydroxyisoflavone reductase